MTGRSWKVHLEKKKELLRLYRSGMRVVDIAKRLKLSVGWVSSIANRNGLKREIHHKQKR